MVTLWILALLAVAGLGYWIRQSLNRSAGRKEKESARKESARQMLERDRLDCRELEESLKARFSSTIEPEPGAEAPGSRR